MDLLKANDLCKVYIFCIKDMDYKEHICLVLEDEEVSCYNDFHYDIDIIEVLIENRIESVEVQDVEKY